MAKYEAGEAPEQLMDALVRLTANHQRPTLEEIAKKAGYRSKATVGNYFRDRQHLVAATVQRELQRVDETVKDPTDDLRADLVELARSYYGYYVANPFLMLIILEIAGDDELREEVQRYQASTLSRLTDLYDHHRVAGRWSAWVQAGGREQILDRVSAPFLGGIFTRVLWSQVGIAEQEFDPVAYVDAFLDGYGSDEQQERSVARRMVATLCRAVGIEPPA